MKFTLFVLGFFGVLTCAGQETDLVIKNAKPLNKSVSELYYQTNLR